MITDDFQVKLESAIQWERWEIELLGHLEMIVGANGIALSYVIHQNFVLNHINQLKWDEEARLADPHTVNRYKLDALAVHNIITHNISETSHAYTYIKPKTKKNNGRIDIEALRARYHNQKMQDMYIVGIYCPLITDWIELTQAQIPPPPQMQNGDTVSPYVML